MKSSNKSGKITANQKTTNSETFWKLNSGSTDGKIHLRVSNNTQYHFGFRWVYQDEEDEFDEEIRKIRKEAGIIDPEPPPKTFRFKTSGNSVTGQILYSGTLTVNNPRYIKHITNVQSESAGSDKPDDTKLD